MTDLYPNSQCQCCGQGLRDDGTCQNNECTVSTDLERIYQVATPEETTVLNALQLRAGINNSDVDDGDALADYMIKVDRTQGRLDAAVIAHRDNPTEATKAALMAVMKEHNEAFLREQTGEFIRRTK